MKDFFVSYNQADRQWAEWIAWQLEEEGYTTVLQPWDFPSGSNFVLEMQQAAAEAERTIAILSPDYLGADFTQSERSAAFAQDPTGKKRKLLPVRIRECDPEGLLPQVIYIELVRLEEEAAKDTLLTGVRRGRIKPAVPPAFPVTAERSVIEPPRFPGAPPIQRPRWRIPEIHLEIQASMRLILFVFGVLVLGVALAALVLLRALVFQPPDKITIAVAYFSEGQSPEIPHDYTTSNLIFNKLKEIEAQAPGVQVIRLDRVFVGEAAAEQARQEGEQYNAAIVIWGDRSAAGPYVKIAAHFTILQPGGEQANPITIEREAFIGSEKVKVGGREVNVDALSEQQDFFFTIGLQEDIAYFAAFTVGLIHYRSEQYDLAVKELEFARDNAPSQPDRLGKDTVLFHLGNAYLAGREVFPDPDAAVDEAIAAWLESAQLNPEEPSTQFNLGVAYYEKGDPDRAIEHWQQTNSLNPKVVNACNNLGVAYNRQQKPDLALATFQKALEIGGEDAVIRVNLGNLYYDQGNLAEAIAEWEKAKQLDPQNVSARNNLGVAYQELGQLDKAIAEYQEALELSPEDPMIHNNLGAAYQAQGNTQEAIAEFQKAVGLDATYIPARINLGIVYYLQGDTVQAVEEWQGAQRVDPRNLQVHTVLGAVYYDQGEYDKAISEWQEALRLGGDDADLYQALGDAYFASGQLDNAAAAYDEAITLNPQSMCSLA